MQLPRLVLLLGLFGATAGAHAGLVQQTFSGTIDHILTGTNPFLVIDDELVGQSFEFTFEFNLDEFAIEGDESSRAYSKSAPIAGGWTGVIGPHIFSGHLDQLLIVIFDDADLGSEPSDGLDYFVRVVSQEGLSAPDLIADLWFQLRDSVGDPISGLDNPTVDDIKLFGLADFLLTFPSFTGSGGLFGTVTHVVPEPSTLVLFAAGAWIMRKRRTLAE